MLEKFIKNGYDVDEIRRETGISEHVIKTEAVFMLNNMGVKHCEYELLRLLVNKFQLKSALEITQNPATKIPNNISSIEKNRVKTGTVITKNELMEGFKNLSDTEKEIVARIVQGAEFDDLRKSLGMSPATIKSQLKLILTKLGVQNIEYTLLFELLKPKN